MYCNSLAQGPLVGTEHVVKAPDDRRKRTERRNTDLRYIDDWGLTKEVYVEEHSFTNCPVGGFI